MIVEGTIKQYPDGKIRPVTDPNESEQIRSQWAEASKRRPIREGDIDRINADFDRIQKNGSKR